MSDTGEGVVVPCTGPRSSQPTSLSSGIDVDVVDSSALHIGDTRSLAVFDGCRGVLLTVVDARVHVWSPTWRLYVTL